MNYLETEVTSFSDEIIPVKNFGVLIVLSLVMGECLWLCIHWQVTRECINKLSKLPCTYLDKITRQIWRQCVLPIEATWALQVKMMYSELLIELEYENNDRYEGSCLRCSTCLLYDRQDLVLFVIPFKSVTGSHPPSSSNTSLLQIPWMYFVWMFNIFT